MKEILLVLILGGSVSSGFSGKPVPELLAERIGVPYENEARICHRVQADEARSATPRTLLSNIDGNYWRSYDQNCGAAVQAVREFYAATEGVPKIMATVPDRNAGWFYRTFCGAQRREQTCRAPINEALRAGCIGACVLIDADDIYARHKDEPDIHLTPEIWRAEAERISALLINNKE